MEKTSSTPTVDTAPNEHSQNIPSLRFSEFNSGCFNDKLGNCAEIIDCKHRTPPYVENGIPVISPGTIKWGKVDLMTPTKRVTEDEYISLMDHCEPQIGDMVFSRNQSLGVAGLVDSKEKFVLGQDTVLIQTKNINSFYLYYRLQTYKVQTLIDRLSGGSTFSRINLSEIRKLKITVCQDEYEQQKIATFLTAVDTKIAQLTKKKILLEQYKKGVMQQMFPEVLEGQPEALEGNPKIRFKIKNEAGELVDPPDWEEKKLGEVATITTGSTPSTFNQDYYEGSRQFVSPADLRNNRFVLSTNTTLTDLGFRQTRVIEKGSVLFVCIGSTIGKIGQASEACSTNQQINSLTAKHNNSNDFIYSLLQYFGSKIKLLAGTQAVPQINKTDFSNIKLRFPSLEEQTQIANFLSAIDDKIALVGAQLEKTQSFKKGLLQQMFV